MGWVRIDDQFPDHPKVVAAGPLAGWLYLCGLAYCSRYLTDGFIPEAQVRRLADIKAPGDCVRRLVEAGLWHACEGGYRVHDYLDYQPSAERVNAERSAARERSRSGGGAKTSGELRPKFARNSEPPSHAHPTPIPSHVSDSYESSPPPLAEASAGADFVELLDGSFGTISADFNGVDPELDPAWLRRTLKRAATEAGPIEPERLVKGLEVAFLRIGRAVAAPSETHPIRNMRGFATDAVVREIREQAHAQPP